MSDPEEDSKWPTLGGAAAPRPAPIDRCQRCGTCCERGGPALHREDAPLVARDAIPAACLLTLRKGELAFDNVRGLVAPLPEELIKLKGRDGSWACCMHDVTGRACQIYDHRPAECRALACWDTAAIEQLYARDRLTRADLVAAVDGLWELVQLHEQRCGYEQIEELVARLKRGHDPSRAALRASVAFDEQLRAEAVTKRIVDTALLDFLFGRPLRQTLRRMYDLDVLTAIGPR